MLTLAELIDSNSLLGRLADFVWRYVRCCVVLKQIIWVNCIVIISFYVIL